jgi:hypothetical protein
MTFKFGLVKNVYWLIFLFLFRMNSSSWLQIKDFWRRVTLCGRLFQMSKEMGTLLMLTSTHIAKQNPQHTPLPLHPFQLALHSKFTKSLCFFFLYLSSNLAY